MSVYPLRLDGKVILVTGGYGYLGRAIVESLSFHGARVIVGGKDQSKFLTAFDGVENCYFVKLDIAKTVSIANAFEEIFKSWSTLDCVINNAFYSKGQSPELMTDDEWHFGVDGTLGSAFRTIRQAIPYFKNQRRGKIINISSMYGIVAPDFSIYEDYPDFLNPPNYGAAKAGLLQITRYYASYLGKWNIQVNAITPGPFPADDVQADVTFVENLSRKTCLNRIGNPADVAGSAVFLSSNAADFITGQNIIVDGGWTCK